MILGGMLKLKRIKGITHGSHIDTVYPDPLWVVSWLMRKLNEENPEYRTVKAELRQGRLFPRTKTVDVRIYDLPFGDDVLMRTVVMEDPEPRLVTAFPVLMAETSSQFRVERVFEWANGLEGNIAGEVLGEVKPSVSFFAVDYVERKADYLRVETDEVRLAFLAYGARAGPPGDNFEVELPDAGPIKVNLEEAELLLPVPLSGAFMDDYMITGKVLGVRSSRTLYGDGYLIRLKNLPLREIDLFVLREHLKGEVKEEEMLTAVGWLQGELLL
ncbi:hypothetical protein [Pyrococcus yayanosii]|uniref:Uncharacterized protein n=1 Tax=Pyrococcus yayanosii (strain CH1 / JCM 16557) TaxID=529709 RepID=F8AFD3_PYRYC|nr:hypothetical protein [Pyrococcus yayanosii]AEH23740.1 conserved hypothetical protein [Pyrococcus yayanosii CH1]